MGPYQLETQSIDRPPLKNPQNLISSIKKLFFFHFPDPKIFQQLSNKVSVARTNQLPPPEN